MFGGDVVKVLEEDYGCMVEDGLLLEDVEIFEVFMVWSVDVVCWVNEVVK